MNDTNEMPESEQDEIIERQIEEHLPVLVEERLASLRNAVKEGALDEYRQRIAGFTERTFQRWQKGFDSLEVLIQCCIEAGENLSIRNRFDEIENQETLFDSLEKLHAKGCLIAQEVVCLLKSGFADGALARWRALHEMTVTALFLQQEGDQTAERYFDHEVIESYKGAISLEKYKSRLNEKGFSSDEIASFKEDYDKAIARHGKSFKTQYGWAAEALKKQCPTFSDLEEAVELDHWRVHYRWASQNIHANAKTSLNILGMSEAQEDFILIGPSNSGFVDPAHCTAISLMNLTICLLALSPNVDDLITVELIRILADEVGDSFFNCSGIPKDVESL